MNLIILLIIISFSTIFHELGHFLAMKFFKTKIEKVSIGFGKEIFSFNFLNSIVIFKALPIGGYVSAYVDEEEVFQNFTTSIMGPAFSLILSFISFFLFKEFKTDLMWYFCYFNFLTGISNFIPIKGSDGYNAIMAFKKYSCYKKQV